MKLYSCRVALGANLGGPNPHHEVPRLNVPRAEIVLLRSIHGATDAIVDIKETGVTHEPDEKIYARLAEDYPKYVKNIEKLFGVQLQDFSAGLDASLEVGLDEPDDAPAVAQSLRREAVRENVDMG